MKPEIRLTSTVVNAGEDLCGTIHIKLDEAINAKFIKLKIKGYATTNVKYIKVVKRFEYDYYRQKIDYTKPYVIYPYTFCKKLYFEPNER